MRSTNLLKSLGAKTPLNLATILVLALVWASALTLGTSSARANPSKWIAPEDERAEPNPIERNDESVGEGRILYGANCLTCHGETGYKGPGTEVMGVLIPNLTDAAWINTETDGSLYYKIAVGKDPMMAYEEYLNEDEIWHIVNYVRTLTLGGADETEEVQVATADSARKDDIHAEEAEHHEKAGHAESAAGPGTGHDPEAGHETVHGDNPGDNDEGTHDDAHGAEYTGPAFETENIRNYEPSAKKAPLAIALFASIAIGGLISSIAKSD